MAVSEQLRETADPSAPVGMTKSEAADPSAPDDKSVTADTFAPVGIN